MKIVLHSGTGQQIIRSVQLALQQAGDALAGADVLYPAGFGALGQSDLFLAALPPEAPHVLAGLRGLSDPTQRQEFAQGLRHRLGQLIVQARPKTLLLSLAEPALCCDRDDQLQPLRSLLAEFSDDIRAVLHLAAPPEALADLLTWEICLGRQTGLAPEQAVAASGLPWWQAAQGARLAPDGLTDAAAPAVAGAGLVQLWQAVFGTDAVLARECAPGPLSPQDLGQGLADLSLPPHLLAAPPAVAPLQRPSRAVLRRAMALNARLAGLEGELGPLPWGLRQALLADLVDHGPGLTGQELVALTRGIRKPASARRTIPDLSPDQSFDATPLLAKARQAMAQLAATRPAARAEGQPAAAAPRRRRAAEPLSPAGEALLSPAAKEIFRTFAGGKYWPRNQGVVGFDEAAVQPAFPADPGLPTGTLIVGCMKNEGPYILEWVAYHKAIGVDHFLIFTNDCTDGTDEILQRLMALGHVTHVSNDGWKGKSPQQAALNKALKMEVVQRAEWLIHIDVDEYINIRTGNGTLADLYAGMGKATNLAMTWRMFGNAGQDEIGTASVIDRFTGCAPAYVPKPHTMWGFKSITRNVGAYDKLSCHRPNHLDAGLRDRVRWMNGSLQDHTAELRDKGWRSSIQSIGYDAVQLNHYALRSRESFLIKRQRGRALHVDRSIGLNYWVRHDWHRNTDRTILRQVPRCQAMRAQFLADPELAVFQDRALDWHRARAAELRGTEAFAELWEQTRQAELSDGERMAFAVAEDMET